MTAFAQVAVSAALVIAAIPFAGAALYLALLAALARVRQAPVQADDVRFDIVVPAHDEEPVIGTTVASLLALDYPTERFRLFVVADNCTDRTAQVARAAGARVLERHDATNRGKGHALAYAFQRSHADGVADAVVVVDADSVVSSNLLHAFAARLAAGERVVQASYGVRREGGGWRVRLMSLAFTLFHDVRSLAREQLHLSCGLRGNGMCFARDVLADVPYAAFSIVEDLEYGIDLGMAGIRVAYAPEAHVLGDIPSGEKASRSQRDRWEGGRAAIARAQRSRLLAAAARRRDPVLLDLALDLVVPPLGTLAAGTLLGGLVALAARWNGWVGELPLVAWGIAALGLIVYVGRGCALSGTGWRALADLAWAPVYVSWKLVRRLTSGRPRTAEWVRTSREVGQP